MKLDLTSDHSSSSVSSTCSDTTSINSKSSNSNITETVSKDSDNEELIQNVAAYTPSLIERDRVREYLEKNPSDRTEKDIQFLLDFMQHMPAFSNMTMSMKQSLCSIMVFAVVEKSGTVVLSDGEKLDSWSVILNGHVEVAKLDGTIQHLHMGDSFGVSPTKDTIYHEGVMTTKSDDCQFVCIPQKDFYDILHKEKENIIKIQNTENGEVTMVMEKREMVDQKSSKGFIQGRVVLRATPEMLMHHLMDDNIMDATYVQDFLLTYKTFYKSPHDIACYLADCLQMTDTSDKAFEVMHTWLSNHFIDFESNVDLFSQLEVFLDTLRKKGLSERLSTLNQVCTNRANMRQVLLVLKSDVEPLQFVLTGGQEKGLNKIFVCDIVKCSCAAKSGLRIADQIISVNNQNFEGITLRKAYEIIQSTNHLMLTVKSNLFDFEKIKSKATLAESVKSTFNSASTTTTSTTTTAAASSTEGVDTDSTTTSTKMMNAHEYDNQSSIHNSTIHQSAFKPSSHLRQHIQQQMQRQQYKQQGNKSCKQQQSPSQPSKFRQTFKMTLLNKNETNSETMYGFKNYLSSSSSSSSSSSTSALNEQQLLLHNNSCFDTNSKMSSLTINNNNNLNSNNNLMEQVMSIVVYRPDQSHKHFLVKKNTTVQEVIDMCVKEFELSDNKNNLSLCQVSMDGSGIMKTKQLPSHTTDLAQLLTLNSRYYLRDNLSAARLTNSDLATILSVEVNLLQLPYMEVACQLTNRDLELFRSIDPLEYVNDLFEISTVTKLTRFSEIVNEEMFWVVTEVCSEPNTFKRSKIIKQFIKIAERCYKLKNFNSMFAILSGLGHGSLSRLKQTWEKVPDKYIKLFEEMQGFMDPSRNMLKYRNLILNAHPPMIPFFPLIKKDLTFIHFGNDSRVDGLVNFDKLRMIAKEIRLISRMASTASMVSTTLTSTDVHTSLTMKSSMESLISSGSNSSLLSDPSSTPTKKPTVSSSQQSASSSLTQTSGMSLSAKKLYEETHTWRLVHTYLSNMQVISNENKLSSMSLTCEGKSSKKSQLPVTLTPSSSSSSMSLVAVVTSASQNSSFNAPKFGSDSPTAIMKLMSLSESSKPRSLPATAYVVDSYKNKNVLCNNNKLINTNNNNECNNEVLIKNSCKNIKLLNNAMTMTTTTTSLPATLSITTSLSSTTTITSKCKPSIQMNMDPPSLKSPTTKMRPPPLILSSESSSVISACSPGKLSGQGGKNNSKCNELLKNYNNNHDSNNNNIDNNNNNDNNNNYNNNNNNHNNNNNNDNNNNNNNNNSDNSNNNDDKKYPVTMLSSNQTKCQPTSTTTTSFTSTTASTSTSSSSSSSSQILMSSKSLITTTSSMITTQMSSSSSLLTSHHRSSSTSSGIYSMASASSLHHHDDNNVKNHYEDDTMKCDDDPDNDDLNGDEVHSEDSEDYYHFCNGMLPHRVDDFNADHSNSSTLVFKHRQTTERYQDDVQFPHQQLSQQQFQSSMEKPHNKIINGSEKCSMQQSHDSRNTSYFDQNQNHQKQQEHYVTSSCQKIISQKSKLNSRDDCCNCLENELKNKTNIPCSSNAITNNHNLNLTCNNIASYSNNINNSNEHLNNINIINNINNNNNNYSNINNNCNYSNINNNYSNINNNYNNNYSNINNNRNRNSGLKPSSFFQHSQCCCCSVCFHSTYKYAYGQHYWRQQSYLQSVNNQNKCYFCNRVGKNTNCYSCNMSNNKANYVGCCPTCYQNNELNKSKNQRKFNQQQQYCHQTIELQQPSAHCTPCCETSNRLSKSSNLPDYESISKLLAITKLKPNPTVQCKSTEHQLTMYEQQPTGNITQQFQQQLTQQFQLTQQQLFLFQQKPSQQQISSSHQQLPQQSEMLLRQQKQHQNLKQTNQQPNWYPNLSPQQLKLLQQQPQLQQPYQRSTSFNKTNHSNITGDDDKRDDDDDDDDDWSGEMVSLV